MKWLKDNWFIIVLIGFGLLVFYQQCSIDDAQEVLIEYQGKLIEKEKIIGNMKAINAETDAKLAASIALKNELRVDLEKSLEEWKKKASIIPSKEIVYVEVDGAKYVLKAEYDTLFAHCEFQSEIIKSFEAYIGTDKKTDILIEVLRKDTTGLLKVQNDTIISLQEGIEKLGKIKTPNWGIVVGAGAGIDLNGNFHYGFGITVGKIIKFRR